MLEYLYPTPESTTLSRASGLSMDRIKTQKARGIRSLLRSGREFGPGFNTLPFEHQTWLIPHNALPKEFSPDVTFFARPCPLVPRHGFVESRAIREPQEAIDIWRNEVLPADPDGELIVMPQLTGQFSGVATNVAVTWGLGNDGVTGKGDSIKPIPVPACTPEMWRKTIIHQVWSVSKDLVQDNLYVEFVEHQGLIYAVQLRDGPEQPSTRDFIPRRVKIKKKLMLKDLYDARSLLEWEEKVQEYKKKYGEGLVIVLPDSSLASHYAVHGIANDIPVITSVTSFYDTSITEGTVLEPVDNAVKPLVKKDYQQLGSLVAKYLGTDYVPLHTEEGYYNYAGTRTALASAVGTIHAMSQWDNSPHLLELRAMGVVTLIRAYAACCMGEARHWNHKGPGRYGHKRRTQKIMGVHMSAGRNAIYKKMLQPHNLRTLERTLCTLVADFNDEGWGARGCGGYGGKAWGNVAQAGMELAKALRKFLKTPTALKWSKVVIAANLAVHTAHNNGYAMNKWFHGNEFDLIAKCPGLAFCNIFTGKLLYGLDTRKDGNSSNIV